MRLVLYEIKKLVCLRYLWRLLFLMAAGCSLLFYYRSGAVGYDRVYEDNIHALEKELAVDPYPLNRAQTAYGEYMEKISEIQAEMNELLYEVYGGEYSGEYNEELNRRLEKINYDAYSLGVKKGDGSAVPDIDVISRVSADRGAQSIAIDNIDDMLRTAKGQMRMCEIRGAEDSPVYEYQKHFYEHFLTVRERVDIGPVGEVGWSEFLSFDELGIFVYVFLILAAGVVFLNERTSGMLPIIRTARCGRIKTAAAKLAALLLLDVFVVLVFTLAVFSTCAVTFGFSSPAYCLPGVLGGSCPYTMSVGAYACVQFLMRCLGAVVFSCIIGTVAALSLSPALTYAAGAAVLILNIVLHFYVTSSDWVLLGIVGVTTSELFAKFRELLVFGHYRPMLGVVLTVYIALSAALSAAAAVFGARGSASALRAPRGLLDRLRSARRSVYAKLPDIRRARAYPSHLISYEASRLLTPAVSFALVLLIFSSAYSSYCVYSERIPSGRREYEDYISGRLFGELTEEKLAFLSERREAVAEASSDEKRRELQNEYYSGALTYEEYTAALDEYEAFAIERGIISDVYAEIDRLRKSEARTGVSGWLIPTEQVTRMITRDFDFFLFAAVVLVFSRMYSVDYAAKSSEGSFASILRTTRRGRRESFYAKAAAALLVSFAIAAAFVTVDLVIGVTAGGTGRFFDILSAPVSSIEGYEAFGSMTVGMYLLSVVLLRFAACIIIAYLTCAASFAVKKLPPTLFLVATATLLPYTLVYMGVGVLRYVDITAMLSGGKLLTRSAEMGLFGTAFGFACILLGGWLAVAVAATIAVRHKTGK